MTNEHEFDQVSAYKILVKGNIDRSWSDWFDGFSITVQGDESTLVGIVTDQSALHGILAKINDLGLTLLSVMKQPNKENEISV